VIDEDALEGHELDDAVLVETLMGWDGVTCATCGTPLGSDPDDELDGDNGLPICSECNRARTFDVEEGR
jgi:hypothetical protein